MTARSEHARGVLAGIKTILEDNLYDELVALEAAGEPLVPGPSTFECGDLDDFDDATGLVHVGIGLIADIVEERYQTIQNDTTINVGVHVRHQTGNNREDAFFHSLVYGRAVENVLTRKAETITAPEVYGVEVDEIATSILDPDRSRQLRIVEIRGRLFARTFRERE